MLYNLHEVNKTLAAPVVAWADATRRMFTNPYSPLAYMPMSRHVAASNELVVRLMRSYDKPLWGLDETEVDGQPVPVALEVAMEKPFCRLLHFRKVVDPEGPGLEQPRVLVFAPLSGHYSTLLRDTVRTLLPDFDVYVTDWTDARMVPLADGPFHLDDYVDYCIAFMRHLSPGLQIMSVCQPTVPVLVAVSVMSEAGDPATPRGMVMMGGPIDARRSPTVVNDLAMRRPFSWFEDRVIDRVPASYPGFMRRVYPGFLQHFSFIAMNAERHFDAHKDFFNYLVQGDGDSAESHRRFYDEYNAVLDMPAEYYLDTIKTVFQEFSLPRGQYRHRGNLVHPEAVTATALFTIEGELDDISGHGQTEAAHTLCTNIPAERRQHLMAAGVGHYGIFSGRRFRESIYPQIREFFQRYA